MAYARLIAERTIDERIDPDLALAELCTLWKVSQYSDLLERTTGYPLPASREVMICSEARRLLVKTHKKP